MNKVEKDLNKKETQIELDKRSINRDSILKARQNSMGTQKEEKENFKWLTEHSRNFLAAGYVPEGITPEQKNKRNCRQSRKNSRDPGLQ